MKPEWHRNLIIVCEKCGKKLTKSSDEPNPSHELKDWLKKEFRNRDLLGANRVINGGCLDICPEGKVAVAFTTDREGLGAWAETVDPAAERDLILRVALERAKID